MLTSFDAVTLVEEVSLLKEFIVISHFHALLRFNDEMSMSNA